MFERDEDQRADIKQKELKSLKSLRKCIRESHNMDNDVQHHAHLWGPEGDLRGGHTSAMLLLGLRIGSDPTCRKQHPSFAH
jgi:hypothetical protein